MTILLIILIPIMPFVCFWAGAWCFIGLVAAMELVRKKPGVWLRKQLPPILFKELLRIEGLRFGEYLHRYARNQEIQTLVSVI